jgi:hypothetical protein
MLNHTHITTRRGVFGLLGAAVLGGTGAAVLAGKRASDPAPLGLADDATQDSGPADGGRAGDPHILDPALDEGPEPGRLTQEMAARVEKAITAATEAGLTLTITSGWRSHDYQQGLFDDAVQRHGSPDVARQWVLPPDESMHVRGLAVDVGPEAAALWLAENGWRFGLCQRYANEPWHFEPITSPGGACPDRQADAAG